MMLLFHLTYTYYVSCHFQSIFAALGHAVSIEDDEHATPPLLGMNPPPSRRVSSFKRFCADATVNLARDVVFPCSYVVVELVGFIIVVVMRSLENQQYHKLATRNQKSRSQVL